MPTRRVARAALQGAVAAGAGTGASRRVARRLRRSRFRRIMRRSFVIFSLAGAGAGAAIKMTVHDAEEILNDTGKAPEEMSQEELHESMHKLGIQKMELSPEERRDVASAGTKVSDVFYCSQCGATVGPEDKTCKGCGYELE